MKKTALVIIDVQNNYFKGGLMELAHPDETVVRIKKVLDKFRKEGLPVFHVQHHFGIDAEIEKAAFLQEIHKSISPIPGEFVIQKTRPSSFYGTDLQEKLKQQGVEALVVVGMMSHMCVDTTVRAAQDYGYEVTVLEDGCTTRNLMTKEGEIEADTVHHVFMASLSGMFAKIMTVEAYIAQEGDAGR